MPGRHRLHRKLRGSSIAATKRGIKHEVLNAKYHEREADIVAQAGKPAPSPSLPTWPVVVPISCWAATPSRWMRERLQSTRARMEARDARAARGTV